MSRRTRRSRGRCSRHGGGLLALYGGQLAPAALIIDLADSPVLKRQIERASALPFASSSGFIMAQSMLPDSHRLLAVAQDQHRCVVEAIANREGARAESIMQEHARLAGRNLRLALRSERALKLVPGGFMIRSE